MTGSEGDNVCDDEGGDQGHDDCHRHPRKGKAPMKETMQQESEESEGKLITLT